MALHENQLRHCQDSPSPESRRRRGAGRAPERPVGGKLQSSRRVPKKPTSVSCVAACLAATLALTACSGLGQPFKNLGKSDVDLVGDVHIQALRGHVQELVMNLYTRNPEELGKVPGTSLEARLAQILNHPTDVSYRELDYRHSVPAIELAFDPGYSGDRVFALMLGVSSMLKFSYNDLDELFLFDALDPQNLYDSARNLERIAWRLRNETHRGKPLLKLGPAHGRGSFEDTFSRMISIQDLMAEVIAAQTRRTVNKAVQGATFLIPIGF